MQVNWLYYRTLRNDKPLIVHNGGSSSSKTYSILQTLFTIASSQKNKIITIVGCDLPNLKKGAIRDSKSIINSTPFFKQQVVNFNKSENVYYFKTDSIIEFTSYQDELDARSGKRTHCFINEANGVAYPIFEQLRIRTSEQMIIDFNPSAEFWAHKHLRGRDDVDWINSNFQDNAFIHPQVKKSILSYEPTEKNKKQGTANEYRWKVYGLGEVARLEGLVFPDYEIVDWFPNKNIKWRMYGMDFGYTNDPTTLVEVVLHRGELFIREHIYKRGLMTPDIDKHLKEVEGLHSYDEIIADSAEPKSIAELQMFGWNIKPAIKGKDSIIYGIDTLNRYKLNIYAKSKNLIEEFGSYIWKKDKEGNSLNVPIDRYNHLIDALRYAVSYRHQIAEAPDEQAMQDLSALNDYEEAVYL